MKKIIMIMLSAVMLVSCLTDIARPISIKGQADYGSDFGAKEILGRRKVNQQIGGYIIPMPENMVFKYGSTANGTDKLLGKKRKYLYDNISKTGTDIYLIEEPIEKFINYSESDSNVWESEGKKNGRYKMMAIAYSSRGGINRNKTRSIFNM